MTPAQRRSALIAWITVALAGGGLTWLGLVGAGLLLSRGGIATRQDWAIAAAVLAAGVLTLLGAVAMIGRLRQRR